MLKYNNNQYISLLSISFSDFYISHCTRKGIFLSQIDQLIDWIPIEQEIRRHCAPVSDVVGRPAYPGLLLFKMLLPGLWPGGLSDQAANSAGSAEKSCVTGAGQSQCMALSC
jgi:transposase, IS5 family